jgi:hypothetical protein
VIEVNVFVDRATRSTSQTHDHDKYPEKAFDLRILGAAHRNRTDDLRITRSISRGVGTRWLSVDLPYFQQFRGLQRRRMRDLNPRGWLAQHDFQSCTLDPEGDRALVRPGGLTSLHVRSSPSAVGHSIGVSTWSVTLTGMCDRARWPSHCIVILRTAW